MVGNFTDFVPNFQTKWFKYKSGSFKYQFYLVIHYKKPANVVYNKYKLQ